MFLIFLANSIIYVKDNSESIELRNTHFDNNLGYYVLQVDSSKSLIITNSSCTNNPIDSVTKSGSCFSLKNIKIVNISNLTINNCSSSFTTPGLKIIYDQFFSFLNAIPTVCFFINEEFFIFFQGFY